MTVTRSARFSFLTLAALSACSGTATSPQAPAAPQSIAVDVHPPAAQVKPGDSVSFSATVTGTADTSVRWTVQESGGGQIDATGRYLAPQSTGTYHVVAQPNADPTKSAMATVTVTPTPVVAVDLVPSTASLSAGQAITFRATVTGTSNTAVIWSVQESSGCGSVTQAGVYTAPASARTCHVVATSSADSTKSATATVTVTVTPPPPVVSVTVTPATASVDTCQSVTFRATVTGTSNTAVTWSVQEGAAGGVVTAGGVYTAPSSAGPYHVVATSQADPTKSSTAAIAASDRILAVAVSPQQVSVAPGGSAQFTATVTTTCGAFTSTSTIAAGGTGATN
jgi:uncharacterized protein YjdB